MTFLFLFFCCRVRIPESGTYLELENVSITSIYSRRAPSIALPIQPIYHKIGPNWPNWPNRQCCLAGSSKTAPRILIFLIAMDADNSFYVKFIATNAPTADCWAVLWLVEKWAIDFLSDAFWNLLPYLNFALIKNNKKFYAGNKAIQKWSSLIFPVPVFVLFF